MPVISGEFDGGLLNSLSQLERFELGGSYGSIQGMCRLAGKSMVNACAFPTSVCLDLRRIATASQYLHDRSMHLTPADSSSRALSGSIAPVRP